MSSVHCWRRRKDDHLPIIVSRVNQFTQYIGGFKGDWRTVPSGQNVESKLKLLSEEGVKFDAKGILLDKRHFFDDFKV